MEAWRAQGVHLCLLSESPIDPQGKRLIPLPRPIVNGLYALAWACDDTGSYEDVEKEYQRLACGLVASVESQPENGLYRVAVPRPLRVVFAAKDEGWYPEYGYLFLRQNKPWPVGFRDGEMHEIACWAWLGLSNPGWRLVKRPKFEGEVALEVGEGACQISLHLFQPVSLGRLNMGAYRLASAWKYAANALKSVFA
jgi:hypothetical protein